MAGECRTREQVGHSAVRNQPHGQLAAAALKPRESRRSEEIDMPWMALLRYCQGLKILTLIQRRKEGFRLLGL